MAIRTEGQLRDILYNGGHHRASVSSHLFQSFTHGGHLKDIEMDASFLWQISKLGRIGSSRLRFDDDFSDRLNYQFTGILLFLFIGLIGLRQYVGKPIQCWVPQEFTRGWEEYAENYCWVANTYFASITHSLPQNTGERLIGYYQWAPIVLAVQALLFYIPCLVWRLFSGYSGFNLRRILQLACDANNMVPEVLNKNIRCIARYIEGCITRQRSSNMGFWRQCKRCIMYCSCFFCGRRYGNFLVLLYFTVKLLYLLNLVGQLYMMQRFIGTNSTFFGLQVLYDLTQGREWTESGHFPRVTFCDVEAKKLGKNHQYTLQCVLPLNMFLEKIYIFLWLWHIILSFITLTSLISWVMRMTFSGRRLRFIRRYLKMMNTLKDTDKTTSRKFVESYLRMDGVFLLNLISINCGDIIAGDLTCELWNIYRHKRLQDMDDHRVDDKPVHNYSVYSNTEKPNDDSIV